MGRSSAGNDGEQRGLDLRRCCSARISSAILSEHRPGSVGVRGSSPLSSTLDGLDFGPGLFRSAGPSHFRWQLLRSAEDVTRAVDRASPHRRQESGVGGDGESRSRSARGPMAVLGEVPGAEQAGRAGVPWTMQRRREVKALCPASSPLTAPHVPRTRRSPCPATLPRPSSRPGARKRPIGVTGGFVLTDQGADAPRDQSLPLRCTRSISASSSTSS